MEGSESAINRVGRAMWTVWGYLTGAVGRYLRPEVRNEEAQNVQQEDTVPISKSYKELKVKDEEKERAETKMRDDLQYPGVRVRAAAVEWEKGNFAHCEDKLKSKLTCGGSEAGDKKSQAQNQLSHCTEQEDSPANVDADGKNQDRTFSGSEEADLNVEWNKTNQEQTKKPEEEEKIMRRKFDETDEEPIKSDQGLLAKEAELNETRKDYQEQGNEEEEKHVGESIKRENDGMEAEDKTVKSEFIVQGLLAKEAELNVERSESNQIPTKKLEEEGVEIIRRANDETGEELTKSESIEHFLLAKEADLNVERSESCQEQGREEEEEEREDKIIMWRENDESEEEPMKSQFTEQDLLVKEDYLHFKRDEHSQEQRRESQEEEEEGVDEILRRENEETEEEPIKSEFEQGLLAKEADVNAERDENNQEQGGKQEEEMEDDKIMKSENDETENESMQSEFIDLDVLNVLGSECSQEQRREEEEEDVDEIMTRENDESEEQPIQREFIDQDVLNVEMSECSQEQGREEEEEGIDEILSRENEETERDLIKSEFIDQELLAKEADLNVEKSESSQEQRREEEGVDEIMKRENDESEEEPIQSEFIEQGLLAKEADLNVERDENYQEPGREEEVDEEEEDVDEIRTRENDESEEEPIQSEFINQEVLNVQRSECSQEQAGEEEEEGVDVILRRENEESEEEPIKLEFTDQGLLTKKVDLNVGWSENNQAQIRKEEEEKEERDVEIMKSENDETEEEDIKREFLEQGLLAKEADLNVESDENYQVEGREEEGDEEDEGVEEIMTRESDESEEEPIQSELINQEVLNVEKSECSQGQAGEEEEEGVDVILRRENDESEEEPIKLEFTDQGLLTKKVDLNVGWSENNQAQIRKEEEEKEERDVEIMKSENDETEEDIKREFLEQGLLAKEADLNAERDENYQEQGGKQEKEMKEDEIMKSENDESEEDPIQSEFSEQGLLAKETDLNVESDENYQVEGREEEGDEEDEGVEEIMTRESDESEEEPIQSELIDLDVLNVEKSKCSQGQEREEEESVDEILRRENEETEKDLVKCEFADLNVEIDEHYQEQGWKQEEKKEDGEIMKTENDETEKEPNQSVEMSESSQEQRREEEGVDAIFRGENDETEEEASDQGFDPEEPAGVCDPGATAEVPMALVDTIMEYVYNQDKNELNVEEQICHVTTEHENKACKLQMVDEGLFIQLTSTSEGRDPLNPSLNLEVEMPDNATLLQEKEIIQVHNEETMQEAVGNEKDGYHEEFSACEKFTDTGIIEEQKVCDMEMKETLKQVIDRDVETECEPLVVTQIENAEMYKKMFEPSSEFDDEDNTIKMQQSEQSEEQKATSEMDLNVELRQLDDTVHNHKGSQRPVVMTKQDFEGVITQPETETGNQTETVEATSKFRAEVAAVDVKKSAERETTSHEQHVDKEEVAAQKITGQCFLEQGSLLEDLVSADTKTNEAPFSEIKSIPLEETVVESLDEMKGSSLQELHECSSEAELNLDAKSSSPVQINQDEFTEQEASSHGLSEIESEQEPLEMQTDSQKDTEELKRPDEADNGLVDEIKDVISCLGVEEEMSVLTKDLENSEREMEEIKAHSETESCEETSESSMNVELLSDTRESEAEMTDVETMVDSTGEEIKAMEEPIHQEEETDKCHLVPSESEASEEIGREHEEKVEHGQSVVDSKEDVGDRGRSGLKRGFEKITGDSDQDKPPVLTDLLLPSQASSLDFTVQKSKIAVKNPLVRPPKDPRTLINMASVEPLTPHPPHPSLPGFLKKSHIEGASLPSKGVIGFKLPGLGSGFPALRKTETGGKIRGGEDSESVTSQRPDSGSQSADDNVKQETSPQKPKWTPPRQPGMGNPMMMAELKSKLKKPAKELLYHQDPRTPSAVLCLVCV
ncbi:hypothetical protein KOW79_011809 [Hemibagrus wyckioides]|uniref:Uncharacterized protein n=2 Tax=Hemibagrus wyckioides TaxID=337641 RepID=A0A9D3NM69_9TELE|nr:hypothetical protein KOW79_011809 [Hemibagrus wyckioides]